MAAADKLLARLAAIDQVVDYAATAPSGVPAGVLEHAVRGASVQGLSAFEQFVRDRALEWSGYLTSARVPASRLPGGTIPFSNRVVQTLPRRFRESEDTARPALVQELSATLASFSGSVLVGHDLFFAWAGSNIQTSDVADMVSLVGLDRGWSELTALWSKIDPRFPGNASAESQMKNFAELRHTAAHRVDAVLDPLAVNAITRNVKITAILFDVAVSHCLKSACEGVSVSSGLSSRVVVRRVVRDGAKWPEYSPGISRALRRHSSYAGALAASSARATNNGEILLVFDGYDILDWRASI